MQTPVEQLFARFAASGDPAALGEVFDRTHAPLLSLALHLCGNPADAEDALQATFVTAIGKRSEWDASRPLLPWLTGVLTLHCKKTHERRARRRHVELPELVDDDGSPIDASERKELVEQLRRHVERLPDEQRQALLLQLEHGLTPAEIAEVLAVPPGTVRMRLHRGLKTLRGVLPAGLIALLLGALPSRGLAAVRTAVLRQAAAVGGGALLAKVLVAAAAVLVVALAWMVAPGASSKTVEPPRSAVAAARGQRAGSEGERIGDVTNARVVAGEDTANDTAHAPATLVVRIVRQATRQPVANARVRILPQPSESDARFDMLGFVTDERGTSTVAGLQASEVEVRVDRCQAQMVALRSGETSQCEFEQGPGMRVVGSVVFADGRPAGGAEIVVGRQIQGPVQPVGLADAAGRFTIQDISDYMVVGARMPGLAPSRLATVTAGAELRLVLPGPGASVDGVVEDERGTALAGVRIEVGRQLKGVQVVSADGQTETPRAQWLVSATDGSFHLTDLPAGELEVQARRPGWAPFSCFVHTVAGETAQVRCRLTAGCEVRGRVVDERGVAVARATVNGGGSFDDERTTDRDGRFAFRSLRPEALQLRVQANDIQPFQGERDVRNEPGEWLITVQRLPRYRLRFVDDDGVPMQGWQVMTAATRHQEVLTALDGTCSFSGVISADDTIELSGGSPGRRIPLPRVALVPDVEATIVVAKALLPTATLIAQLVGVDGGPVGPCNLGLNHDRERIANYSIGDGRVHIGPLAAGNYGLEITSGYGGVLGRFEVPGLRAGEVRDLGEVRLLPMGRVAFRVARRDRQPLVDASLYLWDGNLAEMRAPAIDGTPHEWPVGRYRWEVMENESTWQRGEVDVRVGELSEVDVALEPGVRRYLHFPAPIPDWGTPANVRYVLRAPDGNEYDRDDWDPRQEVPFRYMPALSVGTWTLELTTDDGHRFTGSFTVDSLAPSVEPIRVAVQPAR